MNQKRILIALVITAVIALIVAVLLLLREPGSSKLEEAEIASPKDPTLTPVGEDGKLLLVNEDPVETLNRYMQWAQYPPDSRPLFEWQKDLIEPYSIVAQPVPVIKSPARNCTPDENGMPVCKEPPEFLNVKCDMNAESAVSVGTGDHRIFLFCVDEKGTRLKLENLKTRVYRVFDRKEIPTLPAVHAGDDGSGGDEKANDLIYTVTVRPAKADWGDMFVEAAFQVSGKDHSQRAGWYSTPHIVAEFQQGITDQNEGGHLVVRVPMQIYKAGYYLIEANLQEKNDPHRFLATASFEGKLDPGRQVIPLRFFGKILYDQGVNGPYVVRQLRARRNNSPVTPDMVQRSIETGEEISGEHTEPLWEFVRMAPPYETREYEASQFGKEEWDSEEKRRRIEFLKKMIQEQG
jgi:hypothetical protein